MAQGAMVTFKVSTWRLLLVTRTLRFSLYVLPRRWSLPLVDRFLNELEAKDRLFRFLVRVRGLEVTHAR